MKTDKTNNNSLTIVDTLTYEQVAQIRNKENRLKALKSFLRQNPYSALKAHYKTLAKSRCDETDVTRSVDCIMLESLNLCAAIGFVFRPKDLLEFQSGILTNWNSPQKPQIIVLG